MTYWKRTLIKFGYWDARKENCYMNDLERLFDNQCCCNCKYHFEVFKHCWHSDHKKKGECCCNESLGFYICTALAEGQENRSNISGKHGICECWIQRGNIV